MQSKVIKGFGYQVTVLARTFAPWHCLPLSSGPVPSGVFDLAPIRSTSINTVLKLTEGEAGLYSPLSDANIDRLSLCPEIEHHLVVGEYDSPPFHKQAHAFRDALAARGITTSLQVLPGLDHFDLVENLASEQSIPTIAFKKIIQ